MEEASNKRTRVLVLGANGMLGNAVLRLFHNSPGYTVFGTTRSTTALKHLPSAIRPQIIPNVEIDQFDSLVMAIAKVHPNVIVNCIGVIKQLDEADEPLVAIPINSLLPHRLARLAQAVGARLIHISTDCVFNGKKGQYTEADLPDAYDLYGRSKLIGEVDYENAITLRTSIIGHELASANGLVEWFLAQEGVVRGYAKAIFSGLPTIEIASVIRDFVLPNENLHGLYHVSSDPITKYDLLNLVAGIYGTKTTIVPDEEIAIDRSLDSTRFRVETGYISPPWPALVRAMHNFR
jgi:dTDP-4-dehydrorhamnose reductase